jgi:hypothetical protein
MMHQSIDDSRSCERYGSYGSYGSLIAAPNYLAGKTGSLLRNSHHFFFALNITVRGTYKYPVLSTQASLGILLILEVEIGILEKSTITLLQRHSPHQNHRAALQYCPSLSTTSPHYSPSSATNNGDLLIRQDERRRGSREVG